VPELIHIEEPPLLFNYEQAMLDPRDGLALFGPLDRAKPDGIRWAVVGPEDARARMKRWVERIQRPVTSGDDLLARPAFPGFEATFRTRWSALPALDIDVSTEKLSTHAHNTDKHQRVYRTVDMYSTRIQNALRTEEAGVDVWCLVIPEYVYQLCRPKSIVPADVRVRPKLALTKGDARAFAEDGSLFPELSELAEEYMYEVNFHHQLKARLLHRQVPTQIVRETTIAHRDFLDAQGKPTRDLDSQESAIAWTLSTAAFYKAGGRPWKLGAAREGVCYIGIVFKQDEHAQDSRTACCGAQMFLDSGDGVVFKGAVGPWYRGKRGLFHLDRSAARQIVEMCIEAYRERKEGKPPLELFIHGRVAFNNDEWNGFLDGAAKQTNIVGVQIRPVKSLKLFRKGNHPVLRGMAYAMDGRRAYLWTRGLVPRLRTYPGREVPNPLLIDICRGKSDLPTVLADILALTKLNYNACNYADGLPVTLKFADAVGEILTAGPTKKLVDIPPLPFKYYI